MDNFTDVVTLNQERLLETIADRVARTMKQEFFSEFIEMRRVMGETNKTQREHLEFMREAENPEAIEEAYARHVEQTGG